MPVSFDFRLAAAGAAALLVASSAQGQPPFVLEQNVDRPGSDYAYYEMPSPNPADCQYSCAADSRCLAFTYVHPGIQGPNAMCWLKGSVPAGGPSGCCVTGVKAGAGGGAAGGGGAVAGGVATAAGIQVLGATYGQNCPTAAPNNAANAVAAACNGQQRCDYVVDVARLGDPAFGCEKNFVAQWRCPDGQARMAAAPPEANGRTVTLGC